MRVANRATRALLEVPAGADALLLQARQPGSREFLRASVDYDRVEHSQDRFNLVIQRLGRPGSQLVDDQELFESLSMDPTDERFVVDALHDSELVRLIGPLPLTRPDATRPARPGEPIPYLGGDRARHRRRGAHRLRRDRLEQRRHGVVRARSLRADRSRLHSVAAGPRPRQHELRRRDALLRAAPRAADLGPAVELVERERRGVRRAHLGPDQPARGDLFPARAAARRRRAATRTACPRAASSRGCSRAATAPACGTRCRSRRPRSRATSRRSSTSAPKQALDA